MSWHLRGFSNYNYARNYDPARGGYVESDPMGLFGGSYSTYAYVGDDPISEVDPAGLQGAATIPEGIGAAGAAIVCEALPSCASSLNNALAEIIDLDKARKARDQASAATKSATCPPDDDGSCGRDQGNLIGRQLRLINFRTTGILSDTQYAQAVKDFNKEATAHNKRCPGYQVATLPLTQ